MKKQFLNSMLVIAFFASISNGLLCMEADELPKQLLSLDALGDVYVKTKVGFINSYLDCLSFDDERQHELMNEIMKSEKIETIMNALIKNKYKLVSLEKFIGKLKDYSFCGFSDIPDLPNDISNFKGVGEISAILYKKPNEEFTYKVILILEKTIEKDVKYFSKLLPEIKKNNDNNDIVTESPEKKSIENLEDFDMQKYVFQNSSIISFISKFCDENIRELYLFVEKNS